MSEKTLSRRQCLKGAGAAGLGVLLFSDRAKGAAVADTPESKGLIQKVVPTRPFGKTGVQVSTLSLGGMFDIPSNQLLLKQALKWGVTYWDTADCYNGGKSEEGIGNFFKKNPEKRSHVFLVTKSDDRTPKGMTSLLERSLKRMETSYIDLYLIHGIAGIEEIEPGIQNWVKQAKADGKIRLFGFSTHKNMEDCMNGAVKLGWIDAIMMTYNFRVMHTEKMKAAVDACVKAGIGLTAMKTQGSRVDSMETEEELMLTARFLENGFTDKQARLKIVWENPNISSICSQMPNLTILSSNVAAALNQTQLSSIDKQLFKAYAGKTSAVYCTGCAHICESALEGCVPVSDIMRYLMYNHSYKDYQRAKELFAKLPESTVRILMENDFSKAETCCPQQIQISRYMKKAVEIFT